MKNIVSKIFNKFIFSKSKQQTWDTLTGKYQEEQRKKKEKRQLEEDIKDTEKCIKLLIEGKTEEATKLIEEVAKKRALRKIEHK